MSGQVAPCPLSSPCRLVDSGPWPAPLIPIAGGGNRPFRRPSFRAAFLPVCRHFAGVRRVFDVRRIQVKLSRSAICHKVDRAPQPPALMKFILTACTFALAFLAGSASGQQSIVRGRQYYLHYCASCHGNEADGRGPMARVLKASPPDLRHLGDRDRMPLPTGTIARFIDGRQYVAAHGPRDMPVWGRRFYDAWIAKQSSDGRSAGSDSRDRAVSEYYSGSAHALRRPAFAQEQMMVR